ncbi:protein LURP-one-related 17 [Sesamum angolense]|uniref:Protein LURP-one-related 17 n=1 Tax=Sesamum angolense TaxID=2727404 RepID=A0AAE2BKZ6_9LAMI|nr:protein LURP-one-related 17 [Sesamum angolense]
MLHCLKSTSRTVHHYHEQQNKTNVISDEAACTSLTVWRKSLVFGCSGFTAIASDGSLAYRVDNYTCRPDQIVLMDGSGNPIFTICSPKKLRLVPNYWHVYEGEVGKNMKNSSKKPVFCARKNMKLMGMTKPNVLAYVYCGMSDVRKCTYVVEGSYRHRSCKILDESRRVVGEIKKKEGGGRGGVCFGVEVFELVVRPGLECRDAMAVVILLDQMLS